METSQTFFEQPLHFARWCQAAIAARPLRHVGLALLIGCAGGWQAGLWEARGRARAEEQRRLCARAAEQQQSKEAALSTGAELHAWRRLYGRPRDQL